MLLKLHNLHKHHTRQSKIINLFVPRVSTKIAQNQLSLGGPKQWMSIPSKLKTLSKKSFKKYIKTSCQRLLKTW